MAKVLVIDDEKDLREDIVDELKDGGYEAIEAENGREGLRAILKHNPDLILCDRMMPEMSGYQLLKQLRRDHPQHSGIPFIFVSALAGPSKIMADDLQPTGYITKPIDFEMFMKMVKQLVG